MNTDNKHTVPTPADALQAISPRFLLAVYAVLPFAMLVIALDYFAFDLRLRQALPNSPEDMGFLNIAFMLPHVMASAFTFLDRDYIAAYAPRLVGFSLVFATGVVLAPMLLGLGAVIALLSVYTAYHQIAQQAGIASIIARNRSTVHTVWKWTSFALLIGVFLTSQIEPGLRSRMFAAGPSFYYVFFGVVATGYLTLSTLTARRSKTRMGIYLIAANALMLILQGVFLALDFGFFMIMVPRIVHDVTAFGFYVTHNANRNREQPHNWIARLLQPLRLPEYVLTPALALLAAIALTALLPKLALVVCLAGLALFHYYFEGVMWKNGAPHRQYIRV